ncbi:hypothetical protein [Brassicibacter mesophilus]
MGEWLRSNLCRCTGYEEIIDSLKIAQQKIKKR